MRQLLRHMSDTCSVVTRLQAHDCCQPAWGRCIRWTVKATIRLYDLYAQCTLIMQSALWRRSVCRNSSFTAVSPFLTTDWCSGNTVVFLGIADVRVFVFYLNPWSFLPISYTYLPFMAIFLPQSMGFRSIFLHIPFMVIFSSHLPNIKIEWLAILHCIR